MRGPPHSSAIIESEDSEKPNDWIDRLYYFGIPPPLCRLPSKCGNPIDASMRELLLPLARTLVSSPFQMTDFRCLMWGKIPCCSELWCHPSRRQAPKRNRNFASCIMPKQTSEPSSGSQCPFPPPQPRARHVLDQSEMDARSTGAHPAEISYVCPIARLALLCLGQPVRGGLKPTPVR